MYGVWVEHGVGGGRIGVGERERGRESSLDEDFWFRMIG